MTAGVTLSFGVDSLVPGQGRGMIEALVTVVAHVGLVPLLVNPLLCWRAIREGLPRLNSGTHRHYRILQVGLVVAGQRRGVVEALVAVSAGVRLPSSMNLLVLLKMAFTDKTLPAHIAFVRLLTRVDPLVFPQSGRCSKTLATLCAPVRFVAECDCSVGLLVLLQVGSCGEAFATLAAGIWLLACMNLLVLLQMPSADKAFSTLCALVGLVL